MHPTFGELSELKIHATEISSETHISLFCVLSSIPVLIFLVKPIIQCFDKVNGDRVFPISL